MKTTRFSQFMAIGLALAFFGFGCAAKQQPVPAIAGPMDEPVHQTFNGDKLLEQGDVQGARAQYERALVLDPGNFNATVGMCRVYTATDDSKKAFAMGKKALEKAASPADKAAAATALMGAHFTFKEGDWLAAMEEIWNGLRDDDFKPEDATLLMGEAYQDQGRYLDASLCYGQVIDWQGRQVKAADEHLARLHDVLRAEPGSHAGQAVAPLDRLSRGDLAALLAQELKIDQYLRKQTPTTYTGKFQTPGEYEAKAEPQPVVGDVAGHPYEVDINAILQYNIRGLEVFSDGLFHPEEHVRRANFALVVEDVLGRLKREPDLKTAFIGNNSPFPDMANDHYAFNAVLVCTTRDILAADLDGAFRPEHVVTGAETLLALRRLKEEIKGKQVDY